MLTIKTFWLSVITASLLLATAAVQSGTSSPKVDSSTVHGVVYIDCGGGVIARPEDCRNSNIESQ